MEASAKCVEDEGRRLDIVMPRISAGRMETPQLGLLEERDRSPLTRPADTLIDVIKHVSRIEPRAVVRYRFLP